MAVGVKSMPVWYRLAKVLSLLMLVALFFLLTQRRNRIQKQNVYQSMLKNYENQCRNSRKISSEDFRLSCTYVWEGTETILFLAEQLEMKNLEKIRFQISPKSCNNEDLLILVNSGSRNIEKRQTIRETWKPVLEKMGKIAVFFVVGISMEDSVFKDNVQEAEQHSDIVFVELLDEYRRISLKISMMYIWLRDYCRSAKYLLKLDDDMMVNPYVYSFIKKEFLENQTMALYGRFNNRDVVRGGFKWDMPRAHYPLSLYPSFLSGPAVMQSRETALQLLEFVPSLPFYPMDDVLIFGFLAALSEIERIPHRSIHGRSPLTSGQWGDNVFAWCAGSANGVRSQWLDLKKHYSL